MIYDICLSLMSPGVFETLALTPVKVNKVVLNDNLSMERKIIKSHFNNLLNALVIYQEISRTNLPNLLVPVSQ